MEQIDSFGRQSNPSESLLRDLGNRGVTVKDLLVRLHSLARLHHGSLLDRPQLVLRRKFGEIENIAEYHFFPMKKISSNS